ncbi:MAG: GIY-YIG nuclease family protein [Pedosphaera sp.]|nr:GIY-YIG nuclease family protein [Pedosphaera sp.]
MFWVYILENLEGRFYIGQTDDLAARLANHNRTDQIGGKFTRKNGPWALVWSEAHLTRGLAVTREHRPFRRRRRTAWRRSGPMCC